MHELILDFLKDARYPLALARFPLDEGGLIAGFDDHPHAPCAGPRWVAKTAYGETACRRLGAEAEALGRLEVHAVHLGLPRLLGWRETGEGTAATACLIQAGFEGQRLYCDWKLRRPWAPLPPALLSAAVWLRAFQRRVPAPRALGLSGLALELRHACQRDAARRPELALLLSALATRLQPADRGEGPPPAPIHGDFWSGNILVHANGLCVVDWSGWGTGTHLDDLLTYTAQVNRQHAAPLTAWQFAWFQPGRPRELLRAWAAEWGYGDPQARLAFYVFLARRMRWELGLELQARRPEERARALQEWTDVLIWLAQHRYPDPFTPMPV